MSLFRSPHLFQFDLYLLNESRIQVFPQAAALRISERLDYCLVSLFAQDPALRETVSRELRYPA